MPPISVAVPGWEGPEIAVNSTEVPPISVAVPGWEGPEIAVNSPIIQDAYMFRGLGRPGNRGPLASAPQAVHGAITLSRYPVPRDYYRHD